MKSNFQALAAVLLLFAVGAHARGTPRLGEVVQVENGTLRGVPRSSQGVLAFKGIPYAAAPVGNLRWQVPQAVESWQGVREATRAGNRCWALWGGSEGAVPQSEDCLSLNVWSAAKSSNERRPVMVWIHGGGFEFGTASGDPRTDGSLFAQKGVILVSLNYRLGVFGFFAHPKLRTQGQLLGNFGIQDQIAALKWVQANIANFGGDPKNITVFGVSSGSQSVSILMASPLAKGLFQKAIGESGSSLQDLPRLQEIAVRGSAYAGALGAKSIEELRAMPADRLNSAAAWDFVGGAPPVFAPGIDGYVIPTNVAEVFVKGSQNDVPLLAGFNEREGFPFMATALPHRTSAEFRVAAQRVFGPEKMQEFLSLYPSDTDALANLSAEKLLADIRQGAETWRWLTLQSKTGKSPVYGYKFSYESPYSPVASHGAEVSFVFGNFVPQSFVSKASPAGPEDRRLADMMMSYWVNFAAKADPDGSDLPHWPEFRAERSMLQIQRDGRITANSLSEEQIARFKFLEGFLISASMGQP